MPACLVCGFNAFDVHSGLFYCQECGTQVEELREEEKEEEDGGQTIDASLQIKSSQKFKKQQDISEDKSSSEWLTCEAFNIILHHQVRGLIGLGASPKLADIVLQLWAEFLRKSEVCFLEHNGVINYPSLGPYPHFRDIKLLCGDALKVNKKKNESSKHKETKKEIKVQKSMSNRKRKIMTEDSAPQADEKLEIEDFTIQADKLQMTEDPTIHMHESQMFGDSTSQIGQCQLTGENEDLTQKRLGYYELPFVMRKLLVEQYEVQKKKMRCSGQYILTSPKYMCLQKTLCFCYLGLLLVKDNLLLSDLLRFAREGHIPYLNASQCIPNDMKLQYFDMYVLTTSVIPKMSHLITMCNQLAFFIEIPKLFHIPLLPVAARFIKDLNLPFELIALVRTLISKNRTCDSWSPITKKLYSSGLYMYEAQAVAYILISLKVLFILDGSTERKLSSMITEIKSSSPNSCLFVWSDWYSATISQYEGLTNDDISSSDIRNVVNIENITKLYYADHHDLSRKSLAKKVSKHQQQEFRHSLRGVLSNSISKKSHGKSSPTCFPFSSKTKTMRMQKHITDYTHHSFALQCDELTNERLKDLYSGVQVATSILLLSDGDHFHDYSMQNYWFVPCIQKTSKKVFDSLPFSEFKQLLIFIGKLIECDPWDLYHEVTQIESKIFGFRKNGCAK